MATHDKKDARATQAVRAAQAEKLLRWFDFNWDFGPAIGMKRSRRAARAKSFGIHVPDCIEVTLCTFPELDIEVTESSMMKRANKQATRKHH